uniref:Uncharacterized protein n=1 Tax=Mastacembelus armatus TaxID=205130 RepID=A0A7N8X7E2_9TELE
LAEVDRELQDARGRGQMIREELFPFCVCALGMDRYVKDPSHPAIRKGAYRVVYRVKCRLTNEELALKCHIWHVEDSTSVEDSTVRELSCLTVLRGHPTIYAENHCEQTSGSMKNSIPLSFVASFSSQTIPQSVAPNKQSAAPLSAL